MLLVAMPFAPFVASRPGVACVLSFTEQFTDRTTRPGSPASCRVRPHPVRSPGSKAPLSPSSTGEMKKTVRYCEDVEMADLNERGLDRGRDEGREGMRRISSVSFGEMSASK